MKIITTSKIPTAVGRYAAEIAQREYLRPSAVVQSFMLRGMLAFQQDEARRAPVRRSDQEA
jgi:hypothetical protein